MSFEQEPKYSFRNGRVINKKTGIPIPLDEPVFVLRAKDLLALHTLYEYELRCAEGEHKEAIIDRILDFQKFKTDNPDKMKAPTTDRG